MKLNEHIRDAFLFIALALSLYGTQVVANENGQPISSIMLGIVSFVFILIAIIEAIKGITQTACTKK